jgi:hypothetical protein
MATTAVLSFAAGKIVQSQYYGRSKEFTEALHHDEGQSCHRHAGTLHAGFRRDLVNVHHRSRLLSDNGSNYIAVKLTDWLDKLA